MNIPQKFDTVGNVARLRLRCLGRGRLEDADGTEVHIRTRKARAALAHLALTSGPVSREQLAAMLWSDRGDEQARASVRQTVHELRRINVEGEPLVLAGHDELWLAPGQLTTDLSLIRAAAAAGEFAELHKLLAASEAGLLTGLDGLDDEFDSWLQFQRAHEPERSLGAAVAAAEKCLAEQGPRAAQPLIGEILRLDAVNEEAVRLALRTDHQLGDSAALHRHLRQLREHLRQDFDAQPSSETEALFLRLTRETLSSATPSAIVPAVGPVTRPRQLRNFGPLRAIAASLLVMIAAAAIAWFAGGRPTLAVADDAVLLAVLPFEQQPQQDGHLAAGLWEHTRAALSRNPSLRLLGRATTTAVADEKLPPDQYRKRFGVTHLLEGSVRRSGGQLLISVSLTRTSDGIAIWHDMFRARIAEPFSLHDRFANNIEGKLRGRLARQGGRRAEDIATTPEVYALYGEARGLITSRERENFERAEALLREAVKRDPNFAPAWSLLGAAISFSSRIAIADSEARAEALAAVQRALALAPNLAQAHATLALVQGELSPTAERRLRRAVALDPDYSEAWMWLGNSLNAQFRQAEAIAAYERALEIDPLFQPAVQNLANTATEIEDHAAAERLVGRVTKAGASPLLIASLNADMLLARGDYSGSAKILLRVGLDARKRTPQTLWINWFETLTALGYFETLHTVTGCPEWYAPLLRGHAVPPKTFEGRAVSPEEFWTSPFFSGAASRALVSRGRPDELVRLYRGAFRDADEFITQTRRRGMLGELAPTLAVALSATGQLEEASYLLAAASNEVEPALRRSGSRWARGQLAAIRAAQGERKEAVALIDGAVRGGWLPNGRHYALDLAHEPAFAALRGDRRFEAARKRILSHIARERAELGPVRL